VIALDDRCASLADGILRLHDASGTARQLARGVTALAWERGRLLVATGQDVRVLSSGGERRAHHPISSGATALARVGPQLVVGYADGAVERVAPGARVAEHGLTFEHLPASPVRRLLAGPPGAIIAGYGDGQVGVWSLRHGTRLAHARLHGAVVHLVMRGQRLYAASELGQHLILDLRPFFTPYCTLLRQVWRRVAVTWEGGRARLRPPRAGHRCLRR
jgi:hypothetical protein